MAWERAALAVVVGAVVVARLNAGRLTALSVLSLIATTLAALGVIVSRSRASRWRRGGVPRMDGVKPLLLAAAVFGLGLSDVITTSSG